MLTAEGIEARRRLIAGSDDLTALRDRLVVRAGPVLAQMPVVPRVKALLSRDGGVCPDDQTPLIFDPWQPEQHRCPRCGRTFSGQRHHAHWARAQHLWIAERAAHLATIHAMTGDEAAANRARDLLGAYYDLYHQLPNSDNVLGPSHLFFSTYLESIWALDYFAAAFLLRECNALGEDELGRIDAIAEEAATIIGEFNEGMSNRQTWNSAALTALALWFGDEELAVSAIEGRTGLLGHLADGFGSDGMWFEGENYHLFAMRGLLVGMSWAAIGGAEAFDDAVARKHLGEALMAPADTSLPDFTFPARKDSRYGVSLAHPAYLECWEAGYAILGDERPDVAAWLRALYAIPAREEATYDAWLHDAGETSPEHRARSDLSWWALLTMGPALPHTAEPWSGRTRLLEQQGLAVIRDGSRYVSLECGGSATGHGHPDRLHLTLHADGVHWLPDPGTGSYVSRDLFWYRSTLAHNAPAIDGRDQAAENDARCAAFATGDGWSWVAGEWGDVIRVVVAGPSWIADLIQFDARESHRFDVPWHLAGAIEGEPAGTW
ncbi:MAG: heparinase II/III domain-containing protein, partial [Gemmatimonadales bacterium]